METDLVGEKGKVKIENSDGGEETIEAKEFPLTIFKPTR